MNNIELILNMQLYKGISNRGIKKVLKNVTWRSPIIELRGKQMGNPSGEERDPYLPLPFQRK